MRRIALETVFAHPVAGSLCWPERKPNDPAVPWSVDCAAPILAVSSNSPTSTC